MRYIYCLKDPETLEIRYVGQTSDLNRRFRTHINKSLSEKSSEYNTHKSRWIRQILENNYLPLLDVLDECSNLEESNILEKFYIEKFTNEGLKLTNSYISDVTEFSSDTKQKMSKAKKGKKLEEIVGEIKAQELRFFYSEKIKNRNPNKCWDENVRMKISETLKKFFEDKNNHWAFGKKMSEEYSEKLRKSKINNDKNVGNRKPRTEEQKKKLSESIKGRKVKRSKILQFDMENNLLKEWDSLREIEKFDKTLRRNQIAKCCKGLKKFYAGYIWKYKEVDN